MGAVAIRRLRSSLIVRWCIVGTLLLVGFLYFSQAYGAELPQRSLLLSDSSPGVSAIYDLGFTIPASETLGSIKLQICSNDPLFVDPCVAPTGFSFVGATLSAQTGEIGFSVDNALTTANVLVLSRVPSAAIAQPVTYTLSGVTNPTNGGTYFGRLQTFVTNDTSGAENDHGGLAFSINSEVQITTKVPPYLLFCAGLVISGFDCSTASGNYINFGNLSSNTTSSAQSQMLTATNAQNGYSMQVYGTTMTSGNNIIPALASADVSRPGIGQFGLNLVANQTPNIGADPQGSGNAAPTAAYSLPNFYKFVSGDTVATVATSDAYKLFTASYIVNIFNNQAPGVYATTLTYVCLANF